MSPILTRPIREQLEHDRVIRQLQARYKRKHEVAINPGAEQNESVSSGDLTVYPDLVLYGQDRGRRLEGTVEVETVESVTTLEAQFEWGLFSKLKAPFHLYVPVQAVETARRLCDDLKLPVSEIWSYHVGLDQQVRFTQVFRSPNAAALEAAVKAANGKSAAAAKAAPGAKAVAGKAAGKATAETSAKPGRIEKAEEGSTKASGKVGAAPAKSAASARTAGAKASSAKAQPNARSAGKAATGKATKAPAKKAPVAKAKVTTKASATSKPVKPARANGGAKSGSARAGAAAARKAAKGTPARKRR